MTWRQARNNQTVVLPTPVVPNTTYITTRQLIAMTTTDINSWAALMCSTERATFQKFKERATWHKGSSSKILFYSDMAISWRLTHLVLRPDYFKTRSLKLIHQYSIFLYTGRFHFIYYSSFSYLSELLNYKNIKIDN